MIKLNYDFSAKDITHCETRFYYLLITATGEIFADAKAKFLRCEIHSVSEILPSVKCNKNKKFHPVVLS